MIADLSSIGAEPGPGARRYQTVLELKAAWGRRPAPKCEPVEPKFSTPSPRAPDGQRSVTVTLRLTENELGDFDTTAFRMGNDRSTALRLAASVLVQVVDDVFYLAQIGAEPSPAIEQLTDHFAKAMRLEAARAIENINEDSNAF